MREAPDLVTMEMIRLLLVYADGRALTTTRVQKLLYELKRRLPENNPVREHLPYYWFKAGAFSEHVSDGIAELERRQVVSVENHGRYKLIRLRGNKRMMDHDDMVQKARLMLQEVVNKARPLSVDKEIRSQYEEDAPTQFYPKFKLEFMQELESHCRNTDRGDACLDQANNLVKMLADATASLPARSLFSRFKKAYFDFEDACCNVFEQAGRSDKKKYAAMIARASEASLRVWETFAYGARLIKHDKAYEARVLEWQTRFDQEVCKLETTIDGFYVDVLDTVGSTDGLEKTTSRDGFVDHILGYRKHKEIAYVSFSPRGVRIWDAPDRVKTLPEYKTFVKEGQLDWILMKGLDDSELEDLIDCGLTGRSVFVSYADSPGMAYRIKAPASP